MDPENPYAAPMASDSFDAISPNAGGLQLASQGTRFVNFVLDNIISTVVSTVAGFVLGVAYAITRGNPGTPITAAEDANLKLLGFFVGIAATIAYYVVTEGLFQRTLAKLVTGTRVVPPPAAILRSVKLLAVRLRG